MNYLSKEMSASIRSYRSRFSYLTATLASK